jgi:hypothetical protein
LNLLALNSLLPEHSERYMKILHNRRQCSEPSNWLEELRHKKLLLEVEHNLEKHMSHPTNRMNIRNTRPMNIRNRLKQVELM